MSNSNSNFIRNDFRNLLENRKINIENKNIHDCDGSASITIGNTSVIVSIYGPMQSKQSKFELYDRLSVAIDFNRNQHHLISNINIPSIINNKDHVAEDDIMEDIHVNNVELVNTVLNPASIQITKYKENEIRNNLKNLINNCINIYTYPKLLLAVRVVILRNDGSLESAIYNATTSALLSSHISMKCIPISITLATLPILYQSQSQSESQDNTNNTTTTNNTTNTTKSDTNIVLDPTLEEELRSIGIAHFTYSYTNSNSTNDTNGTTNGTIGSSNGLLYSQCLGSFDMESQLESQLQLDNKENTNTSTNTNTKRNHNNSYSTHCDDIYTYITKNLIK